MYDPVECVEGYIRSYIAPSWLRGKDSVLYSGGGVVGTLTWAPLVLGARGSVVS
jgi:hypothetical protein